jgi:prephenate dehydratase
MEKSIIEKRKTDLEQGLVSLTQKSVEILKMIEIQKGAIGECEHWLKELEAAEKSKAEESTMEVVEN